MSRVGTSVGGDSARLGNSPQFEALEGRQLMSTTIVETETGDPLATNDTVETAMSIPLGFDGGEDNSLDIIGSLEVALPRVIIQQEDDGTTGAFNDTGLVSGETVMASGIIGDGSFAATGDYDVYKISGVAAGQTIVVDVDAESIGSALNPLVLVYPSRGASPVDQNDDADGKDSFLSFTATRPDDYFVFVTASETGEPLHPASTFGEEHVYVSGSYNVTISLDPPAVDFYEVQLNAGDILGANVVGGAGRLMLRDANGLELINSSQDVPAPENSPLPGDGNASLARVIANTGTYYVGVADGAGEYALDVDVFRPVLESQPVGTHQILFVDFDGAFVEAGTFDEVPNDATLSPLSSFLTDWGLSAADEDAVIDAILGRIEEKLSSEVRTAGNNGYFAATGAAGQFDIEILNSRDHADPFGQPNVSRLIIGGTQTELGLNNLFGIAQSIDVGNFDTEETVVILLDLFSGPESRVDSLNRFALDPSVTKADLIGVGVGNTAVHEAGHIFGNWHTDNTNATPNIMDRGGLLRDSVGVGPDLIFGSNDDVDVSFGHDNYAPNERFVGGAADTLNSIAFGLSTGTVGAEPDPFDTATPVALGFDAGEESSIDIAGTLPPDGQQPDVVDFYEVQLNAGDILGVNVAGSAGHLVLRDANGSELIGSSTDVKVELQVISLLPGGGNASLARVIDTAGTYYVGVSNGVGDYQLDLDVFRPVLEQAAEGTHQILFLDFDGETIDKSVFPEAIVGENPGNGTISPLAEYLERWGLEASDEDAVIDGIIAAVTKSLSTDIRTLGSNGDFAATGTAGQFDIEILNSRDHADPFGQPNVSRVVIGGTDPEFGIGGIGLAQRIDPGNFDTAETAFVSLDTLSGSSNDLSSLNSFLLDPSVTKAELVGHGVGSIVAHEAGHFFGNFHTEPRNASENLQDAGGDLRGLLGIGPDNTFGTADDTDTGFGNDIYHPAEFFTGFEDTLNTIAFGLSTGTATGRTDATISGTFTGVTDENATATVTGTLIVSDPDPGEAAMWARSNVSGTYGTFNINEAGEWTYTLDKTNVQELQAGDSAGDSFTVASADGTAIQVVTVTINGIDVPIVETESTDPNQTNDDIATAMLVPLGFDAGEHRLLDITGSLDIVSSTVISQAEEDGSISSGVPNETGLSAGQTVVASATIGDGAFGATTGDLDYYVIRGVEAGQTINVDIDAQSIGSDLDSKIALYDRSRVRVSENEDADGTDSYLSFTAELAGDYYVLVQSDGVRFPFNPTNPAFGRGVGTTGDYNITISLESSDVDFYEVQLNAGDILGANVAGRASHLTLRDASGAELIGTGTDASEHFSSKSLLPGEGNASFGRVIDTTGTYYVGVSNGIGDYQLDLDVYRPVLEQEAVGTHQILFLDFDGATVDKSIFKDKSGTATLSPLSSSLTAWGFDAGDEDAVIDAIIANIEKGLSSDIRTFGNNGDFDATGIAGQFDIEILNSRDHADPFGQANVSRLIIGGTVAEFGVGTIGLAQSIDVGNFDTEETAVILLDILSSETSPGSLNNIALDPSVTKIEFVGSGVARVAVHEAAHFFGNFHTDQFNETNSLSDAGGNPHGLHGVGEDGIFGTADDIDVRLTTDRYLPGEGFTGIEDTLNTVAFGLSTGTVSQQVVAITLLGLNGESNGGGNAQRSMVTSVEIQFNTDVSASLDVGDLTLMNVTMGLPVDTADMALSYDAGTNTAIWTFPGLVGQSVGEGNYSATLSGTGVTDGAGNLLDGNGDGIGGGDHTFEFHRYYGDTDGDRDVDNQDLFRFRSTFQTFDPSPDYDPVFDFDLDGAVDTLDLFQFRANFLGKLDPPSEDEGIENVGESAEGVGGESDPPAQNSSTVNASPLSLAAMQPVASMPVVDQVPVIQRWSLESQKALFSSYSVDVKESDNDSLEVEGITDDCLFEAVVGWKCA